MSDKNIYSVSYLFIDSRTGEVYDSDRSTIYLDKSACKDPKSFDSEMETVMLSILKRFITNEINKRIGWLDTELEDQKWWANFFSDPNEVKRRKKLQILEDEWCIDNFQTRVISINKIEDLSDEN